MLHSLDFVLPIAKAIPNKLCKQLIHKFEELSDQHVIRDNEYQKFKELNLNLTPGFESEVLELQELSRYLMSFYKKEMNVKYFPEQFVLEQFRMKKYEADGKDEFDWHVDVGDYASARRFMVCFFYLNTVEAGGETLFDWDESDLEAVMVPAEQGKAIMFPPFWTHPHKGSMPLSGPKYILSTYGHFV